MKLLRQYTDLSDAENLSNRLRGKGVFTHISSKRSRNLTGATKVGVWAVLPNQHEDATILLTNNRHVVNFPLTREDMIDLSKESNEAIRQKWRALFTKILNTLLVVVSVGLITFIAYTVLINL